MRSGRRLEEGRKKAGRGPEEGWRAGRKAGRWKRAGRRLEDGRKRDGRDQEEGWKMAQTRL